MSNRADKVIQFIKNLKHCKAPYFGQPFIPEQWQEDYLRELYGRVDDNGKRQYRHSLLFVPRKSGKTTLAAALALYHLFASGEKGGEIYVAAGSRDQASLVFNTARDMLRQNPKLMERAKLIDSRKNITNVNTGTFFRALAADANTAFGLNASVVICDEVAFWKDRTLYDALVTSTGARSEPLVLAITTAGIDVNGIGYEVYDYATKVRDGVVNDDKFLPWIYEADPEDDWADPGTWEKANPALGTFRSREELENLFEKAKAVPALESSFRRLYLNQWVGAESTWLPIDKWDECAAAVNIEELKGRECYGGLDLSTTTDLSSFALLFPDDEDPPNFDLLVWNWLPEERVKMNKDRVPYDSWSRQGYIDATSGEVIDYRLIKAKVQELSSYFKIKEIAYDRWNASQLVTELFDEGAPLIETGTGYGSMSAPTKTLEELVLSGRIRHGGNPVLRWSASNTTIEQDASGNIKPSKAKSTQRIDPIVATVLALSRAMHHGRRKCIYEEREMLFV